MTVLSVIASAAKRSLRKTVLLRTRVLHCVRKDEDPCIVDIERNKKDFFGKSEATSFCTKACMMIRLLRSQ